MSISNGNRQLARFVARCYQKTTTWERPREIHRRFKHCGRPRHRPGAPMPTPLAPPRLRCGQNFSFSPLSSLLPPRFLEAADDDPFGDKDHRRYFTTTDPPVATHQSETARETAKPTGASGGSAEAPATKNPRVSRKESTHADTRTTGGTTSTIIEPLVRSRPFRNYRSKAGSTHGSSEPREEGASIKRFRRSAPPAYKRILVNTLQNDLFDDRAEPREQLRESLGGPPSSVGARQADTTSYGSYPVIGIQVARSIDLSEVSSGVLATRGVRKTRERLSVVAQLGPKAAPTTHPATPAAKRGDETARFVAVFRFGSVVFFNVSPKEVAELVDEIKRCSTGSLPPEKERKDRFCVHVQPPQAPCVVGEGSTCSDSFDDEDVVTADYCIVHELNMKSVDVISNIMAQSVALDAYNDTVDELLADFERINNKVTIEGNLSHTDRDKMFRAVAQNNAIFLKLTKVGIKDRDNTAWNLSQYENISELMREEFDIDRRFEHIEFKLNLIQQNAKFFLEVLANQKSDSLEWIIIVLILLECVLMCVEMSGMGEPLFGYLGQFVPKLPSFS